MGVWVEIHCDVVDPRRSQSDPKHILRAICTSDTGDNPGVMGSTASRAYHNAAAEARRRGYKHTRHGWICDGCQRNGLKLEPR